MRFLILSILFCVGCLEAVHPDQAVPVHPPSRIRTLLPDFLLHFGVDPAIPDNFVAMSPRGKPNVAEWIYWGPKEVLEKYFTTPEHRLDSAVIRVKVDTCVVQTRANDFDPELVKSLKKACKGCAKTLSMQQMHWGPYPVLSARMKGLPEGEKVADATDPQSEDVVAPDTLFLAWVGLNDPEGGHTLAFHLVPPTHRALSKKDRQLWSHFLKNTRALEEQELFLANGHDLQMGYTVVDLGPLRFTLTAEKRLADGMVQLVVIPEKSSDSFRFVDMRECMMGANWNIGKPLLKVCGTFEGESKECGKFSFGEIVSILIEEVQEFSVQADRLEKNSPYQVFVRSQNELDPDAEDSFLATIPSSSEMSSVL